MEHAVTFAAVLALAILLIVVVTELVDRSRKQ